MENGIFPLCASMCHLMWSLIIRIRCFIETNFRDYIQIIKMHCIFIASWYQIFYYKNQDFFFSIFSMGVGETFWTVSLTCDSCLRWFICQPTTSACYCYTPDSDIMVLGISNVKGLIFTRIVLYCSPLLFIIPYTC